MISDSLRRVVVEGVLPQVDCGRFPIKRALGETVAVTADIHADGHDALAAVTMYRRAGEDAWREVPMEATGNDRWQAGFKVDALGEYEYTVEGWIDKFGSWRSELSKKFGAGQDVASELLEGAALIRETVARLEPRSRPRVSGPPVRTRRRSPFSRTGRPRSRQSPRPRASAWCRPCRRSSTG